MTRKSDRLLPGMAIKRILPKEMSVTPKEEEEENISTRIVILMALVPRRKLVEVRK